MQSLLSLQPRTTDAGGQSREQTVLNLIDQLLEQIPAQLSTDISRVSADDQAGASPLRTVISQEIGRYNVLLGKIQHSLVDLQKGIKVRSQS